MNPASLLALAVAGTPTQVDLWTMGPGEHPYERFGHAALRVRAGEDDRLYNIELDKLSLATYRPFVIEPLAKIGDSDKGMVQTSISLEVWAPNSIGVIDGLKTTLP